MPSKTFNIFATRTKPKVVKTRDGTDVAAKYFVYKLYEATDGQPMQWAMLHGLGESAATIPGQSSADGSFSRAWE